MTTGETREGRRQAMTRKPGDLPSSRRASRKGERTVWLRACEGVMLGILPTLPLSGGGVSRRRVVFLLGALIAANVLVWIWAATVLHGHAALLGSAMLAYTFGLRHAVDADHIAAVDNATRKFMQMGQRPVAAGLFFSLGHSTIVVLMSIAVGVASAAVS